jgi:tetratricopeptide (TPR) repeat protein
MPEDKPEEEPADKPAATAKAEPAKKAKVEPAKAKQPAKSSAKSAAKSAAKKDEPAGDAVEAKPAKFDPKPVNIGGESILERLLPHIKKIAIVVGAGIVVVMIAVFVAWLKERKVTSATTKVVAVMDVYDRPVRAPNTPAPKEGFEKLQPSYGSETERANAVLDAITKQGVDDLGAFRGAALVEAGKLDEAIAELKRAQNEPGLDGVLARESLGLALEAKAQNEKDSAARQKLLEDALAAFKAMQPDDKGPRRAYALYHQGRLLDVRMLNRPAEAKAAFQKAKELAKDTDLPELIDERLVGLGGA